MMMIENKFNIGEKVYLETEPDQIERIITGILVDSNNLLYRLSAGTIISFHYDYEISREKRYYNYQMKRKT